MRLKKFLIVFLLISFAFIVADVFNDTTSEVSIFNFQILFSNYDGDTTNFSLYNETELRDLANVILERTSYGEISFQENLDLVTMAGSNGIVDFDNDINISSNLIYVDEVDLIGIEKSVILSLYGLSYTDPEIHKNGAVCSTCTLISYSSGNLVFSDTSFSGVYYIREKVPEPYCGDGTCNGDETCNTCSSDCGECDPGEVPVPPGEEPPPGGEIPSAGVLDFEVDPTYFSVEMKKGTYYQKYITITNNGTQRASIGVNIEGLNSFVFPEVNGFTLDVGEIKNLRLDIYVSNKRYADVYPGKINFVSSNIVRSVEAVLDVRERDALFDIRTEVLKKYINPGGRVRANVSIINMGDIRNFDVTLLYKIIDFEKNEYTVKSEDFAINRTHNKIVYLDVPKDMDIGNYLFYTVVSYQDVNASSYDTFTVEKLSSIAWIFLILVVLVLILLIYIWYKYKKSELEEKYNKKKLEEKAQNETLGNLPGKGTSKNNKMEVPELP